MRAYTRLSQCGEENGADYAIFTYSRSDET